nr:hypothetical protein [Halochromatium salexigens]
MARAYRGEPLPEQLALAQSLLLQEEAARVADPDRSAESLRFWSKLLRDTAFEWRPPRIETHLEENQFSMSLLESTRRRLDKLASELGIGLDHLLLFAFHLFLFRLTRSENVLTGYRHRVRTEAPDQIGCNELELALAALLREPSAGRKRLLIQHIDGLPALESPLREALLAAGFEADYDALAPARLATDAAGRHVTGR